MKESSAKKAFTMPELLVTIVILMVIALIAIPSILIVVKKSRQESAKDSAVIYLRAIENYMVLHKVNPDKYPFEFEPGKTYTVEEIKKIIGDEIKNPISGDVTTGDSDNINNASINIDGYEITCKSSGECEVGEKPVIHVIIPEGWDKEKVIEIIVVTPGIGLDDKPFSYDGGNTWTDDKTKTITENGEIDIKAKDKNGKEIEDIYICTKKVNGVGENCYKYEPGTGDDSLKKGGSGKGDSAGNGSNNSGKIVVSGVDNVAPTCELEITGTKGEDGYYRSDIEARISETRDLAKTYADYYGDGSGIKSTSINFEKITTDGSYKITGTVIDNVGNKGECSKVVTRDTKKPTVEIFIDGTARSDGYESGAKAVIKCSDETGKISYQTPDVILNGGGTKTVTATCKDNAGNEVTTSKTYNVYEYSSNTSCGYKSCASSACGTATGTRNTGQTYSCGSYECGTETCYDYADIDGDCGETCTTTPQRCTTSPKNCVKVCDEAAVAACEKDIYPKERCRSGRAGACHNECTGGETTCTGGGTTCTPKTCRPRRVKSTCPKYCTKTCNKTESYTYNKTCTTSACGNQTCWHK